MARPALFGRLEQEDRRLKKHYGRWMDIVRSLELESFIFTKLTKPSIPVNLVGPQVSLPLCWVPASRGSIHFFVRNKEALPCGCRGPSCQPLHVQYSSDGSRSLTTLTRPHQQHHGGGRRRGLGRGRPGPWKTRQWMRTRRGVRGFTGSLRCEAAVAAE